jgi:hypothetical protein
MQHLQSFEIVFATPGQLRKTVNYGFLAHNVVNSHVPFLMAKICILCTAA